MYVVYGPEDLDAFRRKHGGDEIAIDEMGRQRLFGDGALWIDQGFGIAFREPPQDPQQLLPLQLKYWGLRHLCAQETLQAYGQILSAELGPNQWAMLPNWSERLLGPQEGTTEEELVAHIRKLRDDFAARVAELQSAFDALPQQVQRRKDEEQRKREQEAAYRAGSERRSRISQIAFGNNP